MNIQKAAILCCLLLVLAYMFSGCGKQTGSRFEGDYYEAQDAGFENMSTVRYRDGCLYYTKGGNLYRKPIDTFGGDLGDGREELVRGGMDSLRDFVVDDGDIYCFCVRYSLGKGLKTEITGGSLLKLRADGTVAYELPVEDVYTDSYSDEGLLAAGGNGSIFLFTGSTVYVAEGEEGFCDMLDIDEVAPGGKGVGEQIVEGSGGRVYCHIKRPGNNMIFEVVKDGGSYALKKMSGEEWETANAEDGKLFGSPWGLLSSGADGVLRQYSGSEDERWREVLNWSACNLGGTISKVLQISEDRFLATLFDSVEMGNKSYVLDRKGEIPEREELVLACYEDMAVHLEEQVVAFNRASEKYRVVIQVYQGEEGMVRLDADLVSSNPPDLLDLQWLDVEKYAGRMVMEDLAPYLEDSAVLDREDYLDGVLDAYTINGRLSCIPSTFIIYTALGRVSQFGEEAGWDMEKAMELAERYPDYSLFGRMGFMANLDFCYSYYVADRFVDWDSGTCSFADGEFCRLMEWIAEHSTGNGYEGEEGQDEFSGRMAVRESLSDLNDLVRYLGCFDEKAIAIGYPSADGRPLHRTQVWDAVGITAKSRHKEGAWEFMEYFLSGKAGGQALGFCTNKHALEQALEETVIYSETPPRPISQEEKEQVWEIISEADFNTAVRKARQDRVIDMVLEEMEGYLDGYKSIEDVAAVIQNRVEVMLQEER